MAIFKGAGVAIATPFYADGSVNYDEFGRLIEFQIANGTDAIIVCGTTGESATLSEEEHVDVIKYCIDKVAKRIPVIAGTGSNSTDTAIMLSQEAEKAGADAVLVVTPYYNKATQKGLIAHYTQVANSITIPVIMYNVPSRTGCNILPATAVWLFRDAAPQPQNSGVHGGSEEERGMRPRKGAYRRRRLSLRSASRSGAATIRKPRLRQRLPVCA